MKVEGAEEDEKRGSRTGVVECRFEVQETIVEGGLEDHSKSHQSHL